MSMFFPHQATSRKSSENREIPLPCHKTMCPLLRLLCFFAANPVGSRRQQLKPREPFRAARQLSLMNFNLHARHFTSPGWTNAVQPK